MSTSDVFTYKSKTVRVSQTTGREARVASSPFELLLEDGKGVTKKLTSELTFIGTMPAGLIGDGAWSEHQHHLYQGMLTFDDRHLVSHYSTGVGIPVHDSRGPQSFVEAMVRDSTEDGFETWAFDFGSDTDSLTTYRTWEACTRSGQQMRQLLGYPWHTILQTVVADWDN